MMYLAAKNRKICLTVIETVRKLLSHKTMKSRCKAASGYSSLGSAPP